MSQVPDFDFESTIATSKATMNYKSTHIRSNIAYTEIKINSDYTYQWVNYHNTNITNTH